MQSSTPIPALRIRVEKGKADRVEYCFSKPFKIGRDPGCEVRFYDSKVSRFHAEARIVEGKWWIVDLQSTNGTIVAGQKIKQLLLPDQARLELGESGPVVQLYYESIMEEQSERSDESSITQYIKYYFKDRDDSGIGLNTRMIRKVYKDLQRKQRRWFLATIILLTVICLTTGIYAIYKHVELEKQKTLAEDIFYTMKSLELEFADLLRVARQKGDAQSLEYVKRYQARRSELEKKYNGFIEGLGTYGAKRSAEERAILSIARVFGECEVSMPPGFTAEVLRYIEKWKSTPRLERAILVAGEKGYTAKIAENLVGHGLPPHFFYLALQESSFNTNACGPPTRYGIAKGMWQFIPTTARSYGLMTGPLAHVAQPDPDDERHDFLKSTRAAAEYLRYIYDTDAQASGLLVMASYNWGETRVINLVKTMPENPRERNFWCLLTKYRDRIPQQTYDYVFYIVSAAVIGENPALFGFKFENPIKAFTIK